MVILHENVRLTYASDYSGRSPILIECPDEVLESAKCGDIHVKFDSKSIGFLTTYGGTYQMRRIDNSNAQLIVSNKSHRDREIEFATTGIVQLERLCCSIIPDMELQSLFNGHTPEFTGDILPHLSYNTIWNNTQLLNHLKSHDNYYISEGTWKRIDDDAYYSDLDALLNLCAIVGGGREVNSEEIWIQLNEFSESEGAPRLSLNYVQYLLSRLSDGESFENKGDREWPLMITLNEEKVIIHRGRQLLFSQFGRQACHVQKFVEDWRSSLETTTGVDSYMWDAPTLSSRFLDDVIKHRAVIEAGILVWIDSRSLSTNFDERLNQLFKVRPKWLKSDLERFVTCLLAPDTKPEVLLLKTCRLDEEPDGQLYYSSKFF